MTRDQRATLIALSLGTAMLLLDVTVVYVALPSIGHDLRASFAELQWVVDAYTVVLAATLLGAGVVADRFGRKRVFEYGVALFVVFSALCAAAGSGLQLDIARGLQAIGAAAIFSASLALIANEFEGAARATALEVWGAVTGVAMALGPLVGGAIVDGINWRWIFIVNLPIGAVVLLLTWRHAAESRTPSPQRIDLLGGGLFATAMLLLTVGLTRGNSAGWGSASVVGALAGSAVLLVAFGLVERASSAPMLDLAHFRHRAFSATAIVAFAQSVAIYPLLIFLAIYLQSGLGFSPLGTGLRLLPLTLMILVVAPVAGRLTGKLELRVPLIGGLTLLGVALLLLAGVDPTDSWRAMLPGMIVGGIAIGAISPALAAAMVSALPAQESGLSAGVNNTFRQVGIAVGVAALGAVFESKMNGSAGLRGLADGLSAVAVIAAAVSFAASLIAWPLLRGHRSGDSAA